MSALELLAQESPLKQATPQARQLVDNLRQAICLEYGINPGTNELVFHFGVLSSINNLAH
jgi:hypothetical protein